MATKQELIDGLTQVGEAVDKIGAETTGLKDKVAELETAIGNIDNIPQEVMTLLDEVKAKVKAVDDLVADATPETPVDPGTGGTDPEAPQ